jgi:hypothetical protein
MKSNGISENVLVEGAVCKIGSQEYFSEYNLTLLSSILRHGESTSQGIYSPPTPVSCIGFSSSLATCVIKHHLHWERLFIPDALYVCKQLGRKDLTPG